MNNNEIKNVGRREFIKVSSLFAMAISMPGVIACKPGDDGVDPSKSGCSTSADILGPYYKEGSPFREDITPPENKSTPLIIEGNVFGSCDTVLKDSIVEIWNATMDGIYDSTDAFKFRGSCKTGQDGAYRFITIIPGRYLNGATYRPSHIHFRITAPGHQEHVSQIYFKDDPFIAKDPWAGNPKAVERILTINKSENGTDVVTFNIFLTPA